MARKKKRKFADPTKRLRKAVKKQVKRAERSVRRAGKAIKAGKGVKGIIKALRRGHDDSKKKGVGAVS